MVLQPSRELDALDLIVLHTPGLTVSYRFLHSIYYHLIVFNAFSVDGCRQRSQQDPAPRKPKRLFPGFSLGCYYVVATSS